MQKNALIRLMLVLALVSMCCMATEGRAEVYKWVDDDGHVHYTQKRPSTGEQVTVIKPPPKVNTGAAQKALDDKTKQSNKAREEKKKQADEAGKTAEKTALRASNCKKARDKLNRVQNTGRIRAVDSEGNVVRATEEERQRRIKHAQENIAKWCS